MHYITIALITVFAFASNAEDYDYSVPTNKPCDSIGAPSGPALCDAGCSALATVRAQRTWERGGLAS